ncbi:hypothetical protein APSETT445_002779 [Aspergillus pseudonomiae]
MEPHPMTCDLDEGRLNAKCRDRKFTTFLDLKFDYHTAFINRLREHVQMTKYSWNELQSFESKRRSCAEKFVEKYGMTYWGAETRKSYLLPEAFEEPESLCTYPERKDDSIWSHGQENNGNVHPEPTSPKANWTSAGDKAGTTAEKASNQEGNYPNDTKFLVEASSQEGMAPVWVSFQNFPSASSFLEHMAAECRVDEWSPSRQILTENSNWESGQLVLAASVKFEWSGFEIRVRQGVDHDLTIVFQELQKAWKSKELNLDGGLVKQFRIKVMLHVS